MGKSKCVAVGKVTGGKMTYVGADGKGVIRPVSQNVPRETKEVVTQKENSVPRETIDLVFRFKQPEKKTAEIIHVDFGYKQEKKKSFIRSVGDALYGYFFPETTIKGGE